MKAKMLLMGFISVVILISSGCTVTESPGTPTVAISDPVDKSNIRDLDRLVRERLFEWNELPFPAEAAKPSEPIVRIGYRLQHACNVQIPTDQRIVSETAAKWQSADKEVVVDQTVIAYDRPIGAQARAEAKIALTCKSYTAMERVFEQVALVDLPDTSELSFCEWVRPNDPRGGGVDRAAWLCTLIVGEDDLACSVRAWADERATALATIQSLRSLAVMKCRHGT